MIYGAYGKNPWTPSPAVRGMCGQTIPHIFFICMRCAKRTGCPNSQMVTSRPLSPDPAPEGEAVVSVMVDDSLATAEAEAAAAKAAAKAAEARVAAAKAAAKKAEKEAARTEAAEKKVAREEAEKSEKNAARHSVKAKKADDSGKEVSEHFMPILSSAYLQGVGCLLVLPYSIPCMTVASVSVDSSKNSLNSVTIFGNILCWFGNSSLRRKKMTI